MLTRFVILSAPRTGSTMLRHMLGSLPGVFCGGEVLNEQRPEPDLLWCNRDHTMAAINSNPDLKALRLTNPPAFIERITGLTHSWGYSTVGFNWHYWLPNDDDPAGRYLISDKVLRVIHLKRRNLLRQVLSYERAVATDQWTRYRGQNGIALQALCLSPEKVMSDIRDIEAKECAYDDALADHPKIEVFYEELASDPQAMAAVCATFLGASASVEMPILTEKTGTDPLNEAITNFAEVRLALERAEPRWASFFLD